MRLLSISIFSILLFGWALPSLAQQTLPPPGKPPVGVVNPFGLDSAGVAGEELPEETEEEDEFVRVKDTTNYPLLTEVHFLVDYGKLLTLPSGFEKKLEGSAQVLLENRYLLSLGYGYGSISPRDAYKNVSYNATGTYFRPGLLYQLSIDPANKIAVGLQYGWAAFEDSGRATIESGSDLFDPYNRSFDRAALKASWWELAVQSEGRVRGGNLWLGFRFGYRRLISSTNPGNPDVLIVPGYGKTVGNGLPALNLYLKYKISFYKPPVVPAAAVE